MKAGRSGVRRRMGDAHHPPIYPRRKSYGRKKNWWIYNWYFTLVLFVPRSRRITLLFHLLLFLLYSSFSSSPPPHLFFFFLSRSLSPLSGTFSFPISFFFFFFLCTLSSFSCDSYFPACFPLRVFCFSYIFFSHFLCSSV